MNRMFLSAKPMAAMALLALSGASQAAITAYSTLTAFNAATTAQGTDSFSNLAVGTGWSGPMLRSAGAYGYTVSATPTGTLYGVGAASNPALSTDESTDAIRFAGFTGGVRGAGANFYTSDLDGPFAGGVVVTATDASGTLTQTVSLATLSTFVGFTSTTGITSLTVTAVQSGLGTLWPTVDNLVLAAQPVPEPSAYVLMATGLAGLLGLSARRRRASA